MNPFRYARLDSTSAAIEMIAVNPDARFLAGGTNILDFMKEYVDRPDVLIDINALPFNDIERTGDGVRIGALARMSDVASNRDVRTLFPMVALALDSSASAQLRNMASIGGNLLQHTRCQYFRDVTQPCNKRNPGSGCGAIGGTNRKEAVLGTSPQCIATHASDVAVALAALDAIIHVRGSSGERAIPISEFYLTPGNAPEREHRLEHDELITGVSLPALAFAKNSTYLKVRDREEFEFALASAAVALDVAGGTIRDSRIALGGIATVPWRSLEAEAALKGAPARAETFAKAADAALAQARGYGENDFKIPLAKRTLTRALQTVAGTA